jgi:hypothetical protein
MKHSDLTAILNVRIPQTPQSSSQSTKKSSPRRRSLINKQLLRQGREQLSKTILYFFIGNTAKY